MFDDKATIQVKTIFLIAINILGTHFLDYINNQSAINLSASK